MHTWKDGTRHHLTAILIATLALLTWATPPATAGGPTSVLIVSATTGKTASLYYADKRYTELERLLGPMHQGTRTEPPRLATASGQQINVTWMIHDVTPWRVDQIALPDGSQDAWIHTSTRITDGGDGAWHPAKQPARLRALLAQLGVTATGASAPAAQPAPREDLHMAPAPAAAPTTDDGSDGALWWWAVPGLAAGAVLALVLRPYALRGAAAVRDRRNRGDDGPRRQLLDV
ncbi:hypothetical protein AB0900_01975 [Streptomyces cellulosae]|uniref:Secreted protein n=2 Tax=Streptomyces TaxID=1883 RepID=A0ABU3JAM8_9ACTN|nr:hypothetical protein [Streptomyces sp. McG7]MBT2903495.1 hypothetical protein [Streptomyces sp. McG8]MDQ0489188.1 hypothetical protein [Streptomyces thermodiastaticus]MDT6972125.1 hypothetical protein [Streptomyces thermocarboxydus]MYQ34553.1 hypothetical protein [Streptomyces sp. SID4956]MYW55500.1 hypothetical protein [Streptomyces sp. SID8376]THC52074.1 hypothetical protein E7X38_24135 [Streptomyces sp. Akac8]WSB43142.1 hypothetical protein OG853_20840 [Streptomyces cellulosae]